MMMTMSFFWNALLVINSFLVLLNIHILSCVLYLPAAQEFHFWCLNSYRQLDPYSCYPKPTPITNNEEKTEHTFHKNGKNILWKSPVCRDLQCSLAQVFWISMTSSRCRAIRAGREKFQCIEGKTSWQAKIIAFSCCSVNYNRLVFIF